MDRHLASSTDEALVNRLRIAIEHGVRHLDVRGDLQLVTDQFMKASSCHDPKMEAYCNEVHKLEDKFHDLELNYIARRYNEGTDELTTIASIRGIIPPDVFSRDLLEPLVDLGMGAGVIASAPKPTDIVELPLAAAEVMEVEQSSHRPS